MKILSFKMRMAIFFLLIIASLVAYFSGLTSYLSLEYFQNSLSTLHVWVLDNFLISIIVYCTIFIIATMLFLPVTLVLTVLAGNLFGVVVGLSLVLFSATVGSITVFLLVRYLFADYVQRRVSTYASMFKTAFEERGYSYLLMLQLLPITPTPLINVTAGLLPISVFTFAWTTCLGILPGSLVYVIAGQQFAYITSLYDIFSWHMMIILSLLAVIALLIPHAARYFLSMKQ